LIEVKHEDGQSSATNSSLVEAEFNIK
jgi:hypothetical protein